MLIHLIREHHEPACLLFEAQPHLPVFDVNDIVRTAALALIAGEGEQANKNHCP
jgi:hypothetical protein